MHSAYMLRALSCAVTRSHDSFNEVIDCCGYRSSLGFSRELFLVSVSMYSSLMHIMCFIICELSERSNLCTCYHQ